jgi:hypothetical protein
MTMVYYKGDGKYVTADGVELEHVELVDQGYKLPEKNELPIYYDDPRLHPEKWPKPTFVPGGKRHDED